jgi:hypothetical protein
MSDHTQDRTNLLCTSASTQVSINDSEHVTESDNGTNNVCVFSSVTTPNDAIHSNSEVSKEHNQETSTGKHPKYVSKILFFLFKLIMLLDEIREAEKNKTTSSWSKERPEQRNSEISNCKYAIFWRNCTE